MGVKGCGGARRKDNQRIEMADETGPTIRRNLLVSKGGPRSEGEPGRKASDVLGGEAHGSAVGGAAAAQPKGSDDVRAGDQPDIREAAGKRRKAPSRQDGTIYPLTRVSVFTKFKSVKPVEEAESKLTGLTVLNKIRTGEYFRN